MNRRDFLSGVIGAAIGSFLGFEELQDSKEGLVVVWKDTEFVWHDAVVVDYSASGTLTEIAVGNMDIPRKITEDAKKLFEKDRKLGNDEWKVEHSRGKLAAC